MTVDEVKRVREKINTLKERKAKAQGAMESIRKRWKEEFGCDDQPAVEAKLKTMVEEIGEGERRVGVLLEKIEKSYDWKSV